MDFHRIGAKTETKPQQHVYNPRISENSIVSILGNNLECTNRLNQIAKKQQVCSVLVTDLTYFTI